MVASRSTPGIFWVHNDSGDSARVFALRDDGVLLGEYPLTSASAVDWEDIAIGLGPSTGKDYLYVGDLGDNLRVREFVTVYRFLEPETALNQSPITQSIDMLESFELRYPEAPGTVYDCEAMFVDPANGALYLVSKQADGQNTAYVFRALTLNSDGPTVLEEVASLPLGGTRFSKVTGADIRPGGGEVALRLYGGVKLWQYSGTPNLGEVMASPSCAVLVRLELQSEAIAFGADGLDLYTTSEQANGERQPILRYARILPEGEGSIEGEGAADGEGEAEGDGQGDAPPHSADTDADERLSLSELLRVVQLFNAPRLSCDADSEDGYAAVPGDEGCAPHAADYAPADWQLSLSEMLRIMQLYSLGSCRPCPQENSEDGYCADPA